MKQDIKDALDRMDYSINRIRIVGLQLNMLWLKRALSDCFDIGANPKGNAFQGHYETCLRSAVLETERLISKLEALSDDNIRLRIDKERWEDEVYRLKGPGFWFKVKRWVTHE